MIVFMDKLGNPTHLFNNFNTEVEHRITKSNEIGISYTSSLQIAPKPEGLLAVIHGEFTDEMKLHSELRQLGEENIGEKTYIPSKRLYRYIKNLLDQCIAVRKMDEIPELPLLNFAMWHPSRILTSGKSISPDGRGSFFHQSPPERNPVFANDITKSSISDDYGTPGYWIENYIKPSFKNKKIEKDVASSEYFNKIVKADIFYSKNFNGLDLNVSWTCKSLYMNPPYGRKGSWGYPVWLERLVKEIKNGNVEEAITCLNISHMSAAAFQDTIGQYESAHVIVRGRISFIPPEGKKAGPSTNGVVFSYFGDNPDQFCRVWKQTGLLYLPVR